MCKEIENLSRAEVTKLLKDNECSLEYSIDDESTTALKNVLEKAVADDKVELKKGS